MTDAKSERRKIAVLGGGCGSLAAVWTLTQIPGWEEKFDITVYQMGWRLGGKCASGRNRKFGQRIEEHGLHVWAGFYENGFRMMKEVYGALPSDPDNPIKGWEDAFRKHSQVMIYEQIGGRWLDWPMDFPENDAVPGTGGEFPSVWDYVQLILNWLIGQLEAGAPGNVVSAEPASHTESLWERIAGWIGGEVERFALREMFAADRAVGTAPLSNYSPHDILRTASRFAASLGPDPGQHLARDHHDLLFLVAEAEAGFAARRAAAPDDDGLRRLALIFNIAHATIRGMIADGVIFFGFDVIDGVEWRDWLARHGATPETIDSALVRGIYDYVFGFFRGRAADPRIEAGTAMHGVMRLFFTYKGALFWEMQAGMGDIVFAPLYRVLAERGVRFAFFHKVENIALSEDGARVARIALSVQAHPKPDLSGYDPLIRVRGVPAWPSEPLYDQLVEGEALEKGEINLESAWTTWTGTPKTLVLGADFDEVILGMSLAAVCAAAPGILAAGGPLAKMLTQVQTVQTAALQLWFSGDAAAIGAPSAPRICSAYAQDSNTWADMSFLLPREDWPGRPPGFLAYLCGEFPDADVIPPFSDPSFPTRELDRFTKSSIAWLEQNAGDIWKKSRPPAGGFDWNALYAGEGVTGAGRLSAQYVRVNIDPSERYVLSLPGTSQYRLRAGDSGYANLYLAGDWVKTSINAGCVEAAVMAGMDAAAALSGVAVPVIGSTW